MLLGRSAECAALDRLLVGARDGRSGALVLRGEPGVGKTALLDYALKRADGMTVLYGSGVEAESELAFAALHQLVRPVARAVERLPPPQRDALNVALGFAAGGETDRFLISVAVLGLLAEAAEERPLLCLIDDAHWLDQPSAAALVFAARRAEADDIAFLFATRPDDDRRLEGGGFGELRVVGLDRDAADALLTEHVASELAASVRDRLIEETAGNPLALVELASSLTAAQLAGSEPLPPRLPLGPALERAFLGRLRSLPEETQRLALVAAADDSRDLATVRRAAESLGLDMAALDAAEAERLVRVAGDRLEFWHPLVRSAIYGGATFSERQTVHAALAAAQPEGSDDRRAWHRAAAAVGPDEEVAAELERSAERASDRSGFAAAAAAFARAAELTPVEGDRPRRLLDAADAAWRAGDADHARSLLDDASRLAGPATRVRIAQLRGRIEVRAGNPADGFAMLVDAARAVGAIDPATAVELLTDAAEASVYVGNVARVVEAGALAEEMAPSDGTGDRVTLGFLLGHRHVMGGDPETGAPFLRDSVLAAETEEDPDRLLLAGLSALALADVDATARDLHLKAVARARERGMLGTLPTALVRLAYSEYLMNRFQTARMHANEGLRLARETGQEHGWNLCVLGLIAALQGREDDARRAANELLERAFERQIGNFQAFGAWALGLLELGRGNAEEAFARFEPVVAPGPASPQPVTALNMTPDTIEAGVRAGRVDEAARLLPPFERFAGSSAAPWALALVARSRALVAPAADVAEVAYAEALELHEQAGRPFEQARTQLLYGELLRRERKRREARDHLRAAAETFASLGAEPWEQRAAAELRATGESARKRDASTLADLTPQELQIARLVAAGNRNREIASQLFLSPRTVEYHLRKVFAKVGITSRAELAQMDLGSDIAAEPVAL